MVNSDALFPNEPDHAGDTVMGITELTFTQFLSKKVGVLGGLINTTEGDTNAFAGRSEPPELRTGEMQLEEKSN